jgi:hypothetical protein
VLQNVLSYLLRKVMRFVLSKRFPVPDKKPQTAPALGPLLDNDPLAVGTRFDAVDLHRGITDRQPNALDESRSTGKIGENREVHVLSRVIELALSDVLNAPLPRRSNGILLTLRTTIPIKRI